MNPTQPHLLIQSENLQWLEDQTTHNTLQLLGNVDTIYIDPPYNTKNNTLTYNDNRTQKDWVDFMEKRLMLLKNFLTPTGVILVSIDDSEIHHLRILLDQIFGAQNFIAQLIIDGGANKNNANFFSTTHEYVLVYGNNVSKMKQTKTKWRQKREGTDLLLNEYEKLKKEGHTVKQITTHMKQWVKTQPLTPRLKKFYNADDKGLYTYADLSVPGNRHQYEVLHPVTGKPVLEPSRGWGVSETKFKELVAADLIIWGDDENKQPLKKLYLTDKKDQLMKSVLAYPARTPTHQLEKMLGKRTAFTHPKNLQLIKDLIDYVTPTDGVVVDVFAGTGTTGHAIVDLNEEQNTARRYVLVTNNENNIFDNVTKPRLKQVTPHGQLTILNYQP